MDTRLDENQAELGVLVLAVALKVLADGDSLFARVRKSVSELENQTPKPTASS